MEETIKNILGSLKGLGEAVHMLTQGMEIINNQIRILNDRVLKLELKKEK